MNTELSTKLVVIWFLFKFLSFELLFVSTETCFLSLGIQKSNKIRNFESHTHSRFYLIIELVSSLKRRTSAFHNFTAFLKQKPKILILFPFSEWHNEGITGWDWTDFERFPEETQSWWDRGRKKGQWPWVQSWPSKKPDSGQQVQVSRSIIKN